MSKRKAFLIFLGLIAVLTACQKASAKSVEVYDTTVEESMKPETLVQNVTENTERQVVMEELENDALIDRIGEAEEEVWESYYGLEYRDVNLHETQRGFGSHRYIEIRGLKDKSVQQLVNERIKKETLDLYNGELPPYRGIYTTVSKAGVLSQLVYSDLAYYNGSLLSIEIIRKINLGDGRRTEESLPITFNLATGEEVFFEDLFAEYFDYNTIFADYINKSVEDKLNYGMFTYWYDETGADYMPELLKPIENIKSNQKFYLSVSVGVVIILDYELPELELSGLFRPLFIDFTLLEDEGKGFVYLEKYSPEDGKGLLEQKEDDIFETGIRYSSNPGIMRAMGKALKIRTEIDNDITAAELKNRVTAKMEYPEAAFLDVMEIDKDERVNECREAWYEYFIAVYEKFVNETERAGYSQYGDLPGDEYYRRNVYDSKTGQRLGLEACFAPGYDYTTLLRQEIIKEAPELEAVDLEELLKDPSMYISSSRRIVVEIISPIDNTTLYIGLEHEKLGDNVLTIFQ